MQGPGAGVVLGLVFVFGFAACQLCLCRFELGLKGYFIHFGDQLSGLYVIVIIGVEFVDNARYLRTHVDLRDRLDGSGGRYRIADRDTADGCGPQLDSLLAGRAYDEPDDDADNDDRHGYENVPFFHGFEWLLFGQ